MGNESGKAKRELALRPGRHHRSVLAKADVIVRVSRGKTILRLRPILFSEYMVELGPGKTVIYASTE